MGFAWLRAFEAGRRRKGRVTLWVVVTERLLRFVSPIVFFFFFFFVGVGLGGWLVDCVFFFATSLSFLVIA